MKKEILAGISLIGAVIGTGLFVLPHLLEEGGWLIFLISLVFFGGGMIILHLLLAEIILRTKEKRYFTGYIGQYLGEKAKRWSILYVFPGLIGSLLVYVLMGGQFLSILGQPWFKIPPARASFILLAFLAIFIFRGGKVIIKIETAFALFLTVVLLGVIGYAWPQINWEQLSLINWTSRSILNLPGILFFSLLGWNALPMMNKILSTSEDKKKMGNIIIFSLTIVALLYFGFSLAIAGLGLNLTDWGQVSQLPMADFYLMKGLALIGLVAGATSFLSLGNYLKNNLIVDYHFPYLLAVGATIITPLALYLIGFHQVLNLMGVIGALMGAVQGAVLSLVFLKARRKGGRSPECYIKHPSLALGLMGGTLTIVILCQLVAMMEN